MMAISQRDLRVLGLGDATLVQQESAPWPDMQWGAVAASMSQADPAMRAPLPESLDARSGAMQFAEVLDTVTQRGGFRLEQSLEDSRVVRVVAHDDRRLHVRVGAAELRIRSEVVHQPADAPGVVVLDLRRLRLAAVLCGIEGLIVRADDWGLHAAHVVDVGGVMRAPESAMASLASLAPAAMDDAAFLLDDRARPPRPMPAPPVERWARESGDAFVQQLVSAQLARRSPWSYAVAAGTVARLAEPADATDAAAAVARLLRGEVDPLVAAPRRWARRLAPMEIDRLIEQATREARELRAQMESFAQQVHEDAPGWHAGWTRLCHRRDDLEGVRVLLHEAGYAAVVDHALRDVDHDGEALRLSIPWTDDLADERARRVGMTDPFAWWGAAEPDDLPPEE